MEEDWQSGIAVCSLVLGRALLCLVTRTCDGSSADLPAEHKTCELRARELEFPGLRERVEVRSLPRLSRFGPWLLEPAAPQ